MKPKLRSILLIDDDEDDNYFHHEVIKRTGLNHQVEIKETGIEALDYLSKKMEGIYPIPDLIFLDINMPKMNGFEFLESYKNLDMQTKKINTVIVMLTTSLNPDDEEIATSHPQINTFRRKPLTQDMLMEIIGEYFE